MFDPIRESYQHRVYNFIKLSDTSASNVTRVKRAQISGDRTIDWTIPKLSPDFYAGNRVYLEIGFLKMAPGMRSFPLTVHIDYKDMKDPPPPFDWKTLVFWITLPSFSTIGVVILIVSTYLYLREEEE